MNCTVHGVAKVWTRLRNFHFHNKLMNRTKKKKTHRYREQASSYQWGQGRHSMRGEFIRDYIQSCLESKDFHSITEKNKSHHRYLCAFTWRMLWILQPEALLPMELGCHAE